MRGTKVKQLRKQLVVQYGKDAPLHYRKAKKEYVREGQVNCQRPKLKISKRQERFSRKITEYDV